MIFERWAHRCIQEEIAALEIDIDEDAEIEMLEALGLQFESEYDHVNQLLDAYVKHHTQ